MNKAQSIFETGVARVAVSIAKQGELVDTKKLATCFGFTPMAISRVLLETSGIKPLTCKAAFPRYFVKE